jgi:hypothetical protein
MTHRLSTSAADVAAVGEARAAPAVAAARWRCTETVVEAAANELLTEEAI